MQTFVSHRTLGFPNEDFIFHGIVKPYRIISKPFHRLVYKVHELSGIEFEMSVLDGNALNNKMVCGTFRNDSKKQTIVLESEFPAETREKVKQFLLSKTSQEDIRARYETLFSALGPQIDALMET
jgi:hypothetical protein